MPSSASAHAHSLCKHSLIKKKQAFIEWFRVSINRFKVVAWDIRVASFELRQEGIGTEVALRVFDIKGRQGPADL